MPIDQEFVVHKQQNLNWQNQRNHNLQSQSHYTIEPKKSGDFGMAASNSKPNRKIMDKIAQLESVVFTMSHRLKELEAENKEERVKTEQLQLLQT